jgi:hypothetical protein
MDTPLILYKKVIGIHFHNNIWQYTFLHVLEDMISSFILYMEMKSHYDLAMLWWQLQWLSSYVLIADWHFFLLWIEMERLIISPLMCLFFLIKLEEFFVYHGVITISTLYTLWVFTSLIYVDMEVFFVIFTMCTHTYFSL